MPDSWDRRCVACTRLHCQSGGQRVPRRIGQIDGSDAWISRRTSAMTALVRLDTAEHAALLRQALAVPQQAIERLKNPRRP